MLKRAFLILMLLGFSAGCAGGPGGTTVVGGNPAAPPAPPAELPAALQYPSDLSISVTTLESSSPSPSENAPPALVGSGGQFSDEISFGANLAGILNQFVNILLQPLPEFEIPVSTKTTFEIKFPFDDPIRPTGIPQTIDIKIDFSDYDFDGDGLKEGCVGHTAGLPICYRIWFDGQQRMAGIFTDFPTAGNPAAGRFRILLHEPAHNEDSAIDVYFGVVYDHRDPEHKSTEVFERFESAGEPVDVKNPNVADECIFVSQEGPDATAKKRLALSAQGFPTSFPGVTGEPNSVQYLGQWREDNDFWSGKVARINIDIQEFHDPNVCAFISTANASDRGNCQDLGIDVDDPVEIAFIDFLTADDVRLPDDFPTSPTF